MDFSYEAKKRRYEELARKQMSYVRRVFLLVFGFLGGIFAVMGGVLLLCKVADEDGTMVGIVFLPMGLVFLLFGVILYFCAGHTSWDSYERYLSRVERQGYVSSTDLYVTVAMQQERIEALEREVERLRTEAESRT